MRIIVVEDQTQLRKSLIHQINGFNLGFEIVAEADSVSKGTLVILKHKPDIVFFDVEIIEGSSFEILDALPSIDFKVVFITAHGHFAIKAIKYSAFDFLLKPYQNSELQTTLLNLKADTNKRDDYKEKFELLFNELKGKTNRKIAISSIDEVQYILTSDIVRLEADRSYCLIYLTNGKKIISSKNMGHYEQILSPTNFIKVHRSHIINTNYVTGIIKVDGGFVKLQGGAEIPLSRRKKEEFMRIIEQKLGE